ncbi:hypothetical protein [Amycolatopsis rubida]|uniref:Uncharacterized protein n=1 Tax=Amycolatopsis rubida TaxID=112413 RepID=A0A1I5IHT2_9PSEU|nr:hypothetical protein [Amycolatopsis rubida]SFO59631.1 hypothetical protein SAMN05421854_102457 [Amycolatopsis rubida]
MADRTVSVKLRADIADYAAKMQAAGKSTRELEAAGRDLRKAIDEEAAAAGRAKVSEAKLAEVRKASTASAAQLTAAEEEHAANLLKVEDAAGRARASEAKLEEIRNNGKATAAQLAAAEEQHAANLRKIEAAVGRVRVSEAKLEELRKGGTASIAQIAAAEEEHASNLRKAEAATDRAKEATKRYAKAQRDAENDVDRSGKRVEETVSRVAARANAAFDAKLFLGLSVGLPAAAAIGAAGVAVSLAALPALVAGVGARLLSGNEDISESYRRLANDVLSDSTKMAAVLEGPVLGASDQLRASWQKLRPEVEGLFKASAPAVKDLVGAVTDFAENAMPGVAISVARSSSAITGFRSLIGQTGAGLSDFLINASSESDAAGTSMVKLGGIVRDLEGFLGQLLANLAAGSSGPLDQFRGALNQVEGILLTLTSSGMPLLQSTTSGFLGTVSGGLAIVQGFASALGSWSAPIGQVGGSLLATNSIAKIFGSSLSDTGFGLKALTPQLDASGQRTNALKQAMADAEASGTSKFKAGVGALVTGGFNPLGVALGLGGLLLSVWGKKAQDAATRAAEQKQAVTDLTKAYLEDNNAIGANVRASTQKALTDSNAFRNSQVFGAGVKQTSEAVLSGGAALDTYNQQAKTHISALLSTSKTNRDMIPTVLEAADTFAKQGGNASDLVNQLSAVRLHSLNLTDAQKANLIQTLDAITSTNQEARALQDAAQKAEEFAKAQKAVESAVARGTTPAMYAANVAVASLETAFETLNSTAGDTAAKGQKIIEILRVMAGQTPSVEEATQAWNDQLRDLKKNFEGLNLRGHTKDLIDNSGAVNTTSEAGSKLQDVLQQSAANMASVAQAMKDGGASADDITGKLGPMREEFAKQLKQLGLNDSQIQKLLQHYGLVPADIVTTLGLEGDSETQDKIKRVVSDLTKLGAGASVKLTADDKQAVDALGKLGYQIVSLPDGTFQVFANTAEGKHSAEVLVSQINQTKGTVTVYGDTTPAGSSVANWKTVTNSTEGKTRTTTDIDPATGKVRQWKQTTDSTGAVTTTFATTDPATGAVRLWKMNTDGTWAEVHAKADVAAAEAALNEAARNRSMRITATYSIPVLPRGANHADFASGGVARPMAAGGILGMAAGGGLSPMQPIAAKIPPNTWRVVGDRMFGDEYYIPANNSTRSKAILGQAMTDPNLGNMAQQILAGSASVQQFAPRIVIQQPAAPARRGGAQPNVTIHTAESDPQRIAAAVSSQLAWMLR